MSNEVLSNLERARRKEATVADSARQRFVEAIREWVEREAGPTILAHVHGMSMTPTTCARDAVEAFADAECDNQDIGGIAPCHYSGGHTLCRTALLKECGLVTDSLRAEVERGHVMNCACHPAGDDPFWSCHPKGYRDSRCAPPEVDVGKEPGK